MRKCTHCRGHGVDEFGECDACNGTGEGGEVNDDVTVLPDGSAFFMVNFPLPKEHWLYAPCGEWDDKRDEYAECPHPILTNAQRAAVIAAARYAIRSATMYGQAQDFDPDALALNFAYALCGPANSATPLPDDGHAALRAENEALRAKLRGTIPVDAVRSIVVEAIRDATGCQDIKGLDYEYLVDKIEALARQLSCA